MSSHQIQSHHGMSISESRERLGTGARSVPRPIDGRDARAGFAVRAVPSRIAASPVARRAGCSSVALVGTRGRSPQALS